MKIDLSVIILNYNTKSYLKQLLKSIYNSKLDTIKLEVIVVDNGSSDTSVEMVKKSYPNVKLVINKKNLGYSKGNNKALGQVQGKNILFLNSDTVVYKHTFVKTINFINKKPKCAALTCRVELENKKIDPASHRGFPTPWAAFTYFFGLEKLFSKSKIFGQYHMGWKDLKKIHQVDVISGAFFLIRKNVLNRVGLFDEDYFMYGEDIDLCFRLKQKGYRIFYYPGTKITHYKKRSGRKKHLSIKDFQNNKKIRDKTSKYFFNTMKTFYKKHYQDKYPWLIRQMVLLGIWVISKIKK